MATQTVEFRAASGLTLTVRLFAVGSDTIVQTASSCTEATNRKGTYAAVFTDPGAAEFELVAFSGGVPVCRWFCTLTLTTATFQAYEIRAAGVVAPVTVGTNNDKTGYSLTQAFPSNFSSLAITAGGAVTAGTVSDKTGYSLSSSGLAAVTSWTVGITGNITGNLSGSVGSISGVTFPTHFDNLDIAANGHVTATVDAINNNAITASSIQANAITAAKIATDAIGAAQLAADAAAEVATATRTELAVELGRIDVTVGSRLATSGYTPPPSAATNAGAVRSELAVELGRIDATVSSRAAASDMSTLLSRLGAFTGSGVNTVLGLLKAIMSKAASTPSDVGGTFSATTDSIEAIRDAMQAGTGDASQATLVQVQGTVDAIAASLSGTPIEVVGRVADGGSITLYAGDDMRVRSGTQISVTITDVGGAIYTRLNTIGIANLAFGASRPSQPAGAIDGTVAALSQAGAGAAQTVTIDIEITDGGQGLAYADNYVWQIVSSRAQGSEYDTYTEIEGSLAVRRRVAVPVHA